MTGRRNGPAMLLLAAALLCWSIPSSSGQESHSNDQAVATAHAELLKHNYAEARRILENALKQSPADTRLRVELGRVYVYQHQDDQAAQVFRAVLNVDGSNRSAKLELARLLSYHRKYRDSDRIFRELLASNPDDEAASLGLVRNLIFERKIKLALSETDEALSRHPNSLRLQEYRDSLMKMSQTDETVGEESRPNLLIADADYFSDTAGHRSWRATQGYDAKVVRGLTNSFRLNERYLWVSQGPKAKMLSGTDELRIRLNPRVVLGAGGGLVRFADSSSRALYRGELMLRPYKDISLQGGFSKIPISPTFESASFNLLAEGWWSRLDWQPRRWRFAADFFKQHYSDSNRTQREDAEVLRWLGSSHFAVGLGYQYTHLSFSQDLLHGYFSPSQYHSNLGVTGFNFGLGRFFRGEYLGRYGSESVSPNPHQVAWEASGRNRFLFGRCTLGADYSYFHLAQSTGAFSAQMGQVSLGYRF